MRKGSILVLFAVAVSLTFSACRSSSGQDTLSVTESTDLVVETEEVVPPVLSDYFVPCEDSEGLLQYTGEALSDLSYPEYVVWEDDLLLYETSYSESGDGYVEFALLDIASGEITCREQYPCEFLTDIRLTEVGMMFCDSALGAVYLLDEDLSLIKEWTFPPNYEYWYLGTDGDSVYIIDEGRLTRTSLESGEEEVILESSVSLYGGGALNGGAQITYVEDERFLTEVLWLDLDSGTLISCGFDEAVSSLTLAGDIWLISLEDTHYTEFILGKEEDASVITIEEGDLVQIEGSDAVLWYSYGENDFAIYSGAGEWISSCSVAEENASFYSSVCKYSAVYGGYFLMLYEDEEPLLLFWEVISSSESEGEDLEAVSYEEYQTVPEGEAVSAELYEEAAEIGAEYGIEVRIADQCDTEYGDFTAETETDEELIREGLSIIESALSAYPEGFLNQLKYDEVTGISINLCGKLTPQNDNWGDENYNGLTNQQGSKNIIVFDASQLYEDTVYHEISHIIDSYLEWNSYCRTDAVFSWEGWEALNPEGFEYIYVYSGFEELSFTGEEYLYFIDVYSMISPTEDRARIMEYAMAGYDAYFTEYEPTYQKLLYYCECIRDAFDTEGWPEVTAWEAVG